MPGDDERFQVCASFGPDFRRERRKGYIMEERIVLLVIVGILVVVITVIVRLVKERLAKEEAFTEWSIQHSNEQEEERKRYKEEERLRKEKLELEREVRRTFHVDLETVQEPTTQDEIIRIMDLLAFCAADACVNQDKALRGETELRRGEEVAGYKLRWAYSRDLVLRVAPELVDRMPHFSEFEPLKSYREEHLRDKAERRATK